MTGCSHHTWITSCTDDNHWMTWTYAWTILAFSPFPNVARCNQSAKRFELEIEHHESTTSPPKKASSLDSIHEDIVALCFSTAHCLSPSPCLNVVSLCSSRIRVWVWISRSEKEEANWVGGIIFRKQFLKQWRWRCRAAGAKWSFDVSAYFNEWRTWSRFFKIRSTR